MLERLKAFPHCLHCNRTKEYGYNIEMYRINKIDETLINLINLFRILDKRIENRL